jgi:hypothetical protein
MSQANRKSTTTAKTRVRRSTAFDLVAIYLRPELVEPGQLGIVVKRLALNVAPYVKFPHREHPDSNVAAVVIFEQDNPPRQYAVRADRILTIHRCIGVAGADVILEDMTPKAAADFKGPRK